MWLCRGLGVFVLWVFIIHLACFIVHKLRRKSSNVLQLGLNCLLLTTNNTGLIGWPVLVATVGQQSAVLSMLLGKGTAVARCLLLSHAVVSSFPHCVWGLVSFCCIAGIAWICAVLSSQMSTLLVSIVPIVVSAGVLFFIQLLPVTICCFEYYKWELQVWRGWLHQLNPSLGTCTGHMHVDICANLQGQLWCGLGVCKVPDGAGSVMACLVTSMCAWCCRKASSSALVVTIKRMMTCSQETSCLWRVTAKISSSCWRRHQEGSLMSSGRYICTSTSSAAVHAACTAPNVLLECSQISTAAADWQAPAQ